MSIGEHAGLLGPAVVCLAIAVLSLIARLVVDAGRSTRRPRAGPEDFGLLRVAMLADDRDSADVVLALLAHAGIRATTAATGDGRVRVLVFATDLDRARVVVGGPPFAR